MNDEDIRLMATKGTLYRLSGPARPRITRRELGLVLVGVAAIGMTLLWFIWPR